MTKTALQCFFSVICLHISNTLQINTVLVNMITIGKTQIRPFMHTKELVLGFDSDFIDRGDQNDVGNNLQHFDDDFKQTVH